MGADSEFRVLFVVAHPDDADIHAGAMVAKLARAGARVRIVSLCNGDKGHQSMDSESLAARRYGPGLETSPLFPHRTNVQFLKVLGRHDIFISIWERGAGYTLASGSSSSAAAAVAKRLGFCDSPISVHAPGGVLKVEIDDSWNIVQTGPVRVVYELEWLGEALQ